MIVNERECHESVFFSSVNQSAGILCFACCVKRCYFSTVVFLSNAHRPIPLVTYILLAVGLVQKVDKLLLFIQMVNCILIYTQFMYRFVSRRHVVV